ncbi:MAG: hypothetical protein U0992_00225 [Planctomycetaceae bacterium]
MLFAVGARSWRFAAGIVTLWIVARDFSRDVQGYYYLFVNLLAIQTFFDLGLTGVLTYVASHEWSAARNDDAAGAVARQRLGELLVRSRAGTPGARWIHRVGDCAGLVAVAANGESDDSLGIGVGRCRGYFRRQLMVQPFHRHPGGLQLCR